MHLFIKEKEIEKIVLEHLLRVRKIEEEACGLIKQQIEQLTARLLLSVNQNLKNKDHSKRYECLYYLMLESKESYEAYIRLVEDQVDEIDDQMVRDIFMGIKDLLGEATEGISEKDDNPIAYERMVMISAGILKIKQSILEDLEEAYVHCDIGNHITPVELIDFMNDHVMTFFEESLPKVHGMIEDTIASLSIREAAGPYLDHMLEQKKQLETLIFIQIDKVELQLGDGASSGLVGELIGILQEVYQRTLTVEHKIKEVQEEKVTADEIIDMRTMARIIEQNMLSRTPKVIKLLQVLEDNAKDSLEELLTRVTNELDKLTHQTIKEIKEDSAPYQRLSSQILDLFDQAVEELSAIDLEYRTEVGSRIGQGIVETMKLKLEVLRERDTAYQESKKDISLVEEKKLINIRAEFEASAQSILKEAIDGSNQGFLSIQDKFKKRVDAIKGSHVKHDMAYLRNELLFEIRTFDEIVKHSVEKLIEYEESIAEPVIEIMKYVYDHSRKALNRSGILFLEPEPHERFDGKLHEIMMAEAQEGFEKGEVIKCQSIGYVKNGYVIMRANIIAAK